MGVVIEIEICIKHPRGLTGIHDTDIYIYVCVCVCVCNGPRAKANGFSGMGVFKLPQFASSNPTRPEVPP